MAKSKTKTRKKILVFSLLGLVVAGLAAYAFFRKREVVVGVQTEKVSHRNLTELVVANGRIQPVVQVVINPEVSGEIIALPVKEGQPVQKGELLLKIKPDNYIASRNSVAANHQSALAGMSLAKANLEKATLEFERSKKLLEDKLISDSQFLEAKTWLAVMQATYETSTHQAAQAKATLARAEDDLDKTTILSPITGTVTKLRSQLGERVVGTAMMAGTEIMTIANLNNMEARVDIGEVDVVLMALGQKARIEVEAFHDRKFTGTVSEIANASRSAFASSSGGGMMGGGSSQEATKFEVKIRIQEKEVFRPGMSVTAEIETRYRTNVLTVPIQSVTTRLPKEAADAKKSDGKGKAATASQPSVPAAVNGSQPKKPGEAAKPLEVVFIKEGDHAKMVPVKRGISDDAYVEILQGLTEGQAVVSGGYKAISRELEDAKKIKETAAKPGADKDKT